MVNQAFTLAELSAKTGEFSDKVLVLKNKILMSQGIWNNIYYDKEEIQKAFQNTDWASRDKSNLFLDHMDKNAGEWIGEVKNYRFEGDTLYGDLYVSDQNWASKLKYGKPHIGISPKVKGLVDEVNKTIKNFTYENFSLVINPAVKTAYINNVAEMEVEEKSYKELELSEEKPKETLKKITSEEEVYSMDTMADLFELWELKNLSVSKVLQKAEAIKGKDEELRDAARRAARILEDEAIKEEEEKKEEEKVEEKDKPAPAPEPAPAEPVKPTEETEAKMKELEKQVKTLSEKLDEPVERKLVKKEVELKDEDLDLAFTRFLQQEVGIDAE